MITYIGIGSCPHHNTVEEITDAWDQIIPVFIRGKSAKLIHYDPAFERRAQFMDSYFETKGFKKVEEGHWSSDLMEVVLHAKAIYHPEHDYILENMAEETIRTDTKLIVQEFTGTELTKTFKAAYERSSSPIDFKRNVLFDITYGTACHCMTDMTKYKPLYNTEGDFINFLLYSEEEILPLIGLSLKADELIKGYYVKKYLAVINQQTDYRRRLNGDTVLFPCAAYNDLSTPDEIMAYLQRQIRPLLEIFNSLGMMTSKKIGLVENLLSMYKDYDVYRWNSAMAGLVN